MEEKKEKVKLSSKEVIAISLAMYKMLLPGLCIAVLSIILVAIFLKGYL